MPPGCGTQPAEGLCSYGLPNASLDRQRVEVELAGLEPATSWVRSRAAFEGESPLFWL